jgi:hypothetical protein
MTEIVRLDLQLIRNQQAQIDDLQSDIIALRKEIAFLRAECTELVLNDVRRCFEQLPERIHYKLALLRQQDEIKNRIGLVREKVE